MGFLGFCFFAPGPLGFLLTTRALVPRGEIPPFELISPGRTPSVFLPVIEPKFHRSLIQMKGAWAVRILEGSYYFFGSNQISLVNPTNTWTWKLVEPKDHIPISLIDHVFHSKNALWVSAAGGALKIQSQGIVDVIMNPNQLLAVEGDRRVFRETISSDGSLVRLPKSESFPGGLAHDLLRGRKLASKNQGFFNFVALMQGGLLFLGDGLSNTFVIYDAEKSQVTETEGPDFSLIQPYQMKKHGVFPRKYQALEEMEFLKSFSQLEIEHCFAFQHEGQPYFLVTWDTRIPNAPSARYAVQVFSASGKRVGACLYSLPPQDAGENVLLFLEYRSGNLLEAPVLDLIDEKGTNQRRLM